MAIGLLGRKVGMTQLFEGAAGDVIPVTVIQAGPCHVLQIRSKDRDGYDAVQLGFLDKPRRLAARSQRGHVARLESKRSKKRSAAGIEAAAKPGCEPKRFVREMRGANDGYEVGQEVKVDIFRPSLEELPGMLKELAEKSNIDTGKVGWEEELKKKQSVQYREVVDSTISVDVVGTSKGRGYAGVMKRHNYSGQRATHGVKKCHRHLGGTGCSAYPSRVFKGKRMAGQYGHSQCTVRNLKLVKVDAENNLLIVKGAVPGPNGGFVMIRTTNKL